MSADLPAVLANDTAATSAELGAEGWPRVETALTVFLVSAAVLLISFISVVTNL